MPDLSLGTGGTVVRKTHKTYDLTEFTCVRGRQIRTINQIIPDSDQGYDGTHTLCTGRSPSNADWKGYYRQSRWGKI